MNVVPYQPRGDDPILATTLFGRALRNPVGLAAGFDKDGRVYERMGAQGFGFAEIGGVTPRAQKGNPRPRVFRLPEGGAVINRMGFPNEGADAMERRLQRKGRPEIGFGINLASNADSADPTDDFVGLAQRFGPYADYLTLDVSCPNTANGQVFLDPARLADLLAQLDAIPWVAQRPTLVPLASATLARVRALTGGSVPLIAVGGIASGADAYAMIRAGASAVQIYTGLIYAGTALVTSIKRELAALLRRDGAGSLAEAVGAAT